VEHLLSVMGTGLDYPSLTEMMKTVVRLHEEGRTILMITHAMETAARFGNRIIALVEGGIVFDGPVICSLANRSQNYCIFLYPCFVLLILLKIKVRFI
jgi:ABC-type multidrug transport system ATPase subunit